VTPTPFHLPAEVPSRRLVGVGGIGTGISFAVEGERTIGRNESRAGRLLDARDYCKLHTVAHHVATLLGAHPSGEPFHVVPVGVVGVDDAGGRLLGEMAAAGMDVRHVRTVADRPTLFSVCFQYPDGDGGNITTADSAAAALSDTDVEGVGDLLGGDAIALAQPEVPLDVRHRFLKLAGEHGALRAGSFTSLELEDARSSGVFELLDVVSINEHEAATIAGTEPDGSDPGPFLRRVASAFGAPERPVRVVVTAGGRGAYAVERDRWLHRPAPRVDVVSTAGCGDALLAGVLVALVAGIPFLGEARPPAVDDALALGVLLAGLNATSPHTIHPAADAAALTELARASGVGFEGGLARLLLGEEG
jgi:sugar/nucleoside kinase (ribokinase family)